MDDSLGERRAELVVALAGIRARIADAAHAASREPHAVTLVAVTKNFPASDIDILIRLGVYDIGENRDQEARAKLLELAALRSTGPDRPDPVPRLHFVGRLQTNKCRPVARYAACVHTVDRPELVTGLADGVRLAQREPLPVFVQVSLDGDPRRGGAAIDEIDGLAVRVAASDQLVLAGVMAVAPLAAEPAQVYARLAEVAARVRQSHPLAVAISAGMSGDFELAVKNGATHVRIGSALLGRREVTFS